jgi:hypothetical protein
MATMHSAPRKTNRRSAGPSELTKAKPAYRSPPAWSKPQWFEVNEDGWLIVDAEFWARLRDNDTEPG